MANLRLGDWSIEVPGYSPEIGDTFSRDILGTTYQTAIMPDGKEWMAEHLRDTSAGGAWYDGNVANAYLGRHYNSTEVSAMSYPGGWRVPTKADMDGFDAATGAFAGKAHRLCSPDNWSSAFAINCLDTYGFSFSPTGWYLSGWFFADRYGRIWYGLDDPTYLWVLSVDATNNSNVNFLNYGKGTSGTACVRLVRDVTPTPPTYRSGTHDLLILLSGLAETTESLAQRVDVRLRTFLGEHWLNQELGTPWFRDFLTKAPDLAVCRQVLWDTILGVRGVRAINRLDLSINKVTRVLTVTFAVNGTDSFTSTITV